MAPLNSIRASLLPRITMIRGHLRMPLYRNGYALVFGSAVTSGVGVLFWAVAARTYSTETVGLNSAMISTMISLAFLARLNLTNALNRFLPNAGRATTKLILWAYSVSLVVAFIGSIIFILGIDIWAPSLATLSTNWWMGLAFVGATMAWCIFALQEGVLIGLRQSLWVPVVGIAYAVAKLLLLLLLVGLFPASGVFVAWTLPIILLVLPVSYLIFARLVPRHVRATQDSVAGVTPKHLAQFVTGDYLSSVIMLGVHAVLPLIVVAQISATANAYFYLTWTISYSLHLISVNMGMSMIAETVADPEKLATYSYQILLQSIRLVAPLVFVLVVGAPYILRVFGEGYEVESTVLLRLLSLAALPDIIVTLYINIARVQSRVWTIVLLQTIISVMTLVLSLTLLGIYGITGIGYAWLISQSSVAMLLAVGAFHKFGCPSLMAFRSDRSG